MDETTDAADLETVVKAVAARIRNDNGLAGMAAQVLASDVCRDLAMVAVDEARRHPDELARLMSGRLPPRRSAAG